MRSKIRAAFSLAVLVGVISCGMVCYAEEAYINDETGYRVVLEDDAQLLSDEEETELIAQMKEITTYGNVALKTIDANDRSAEYYARQYYQSRFGTDSGTLLLIDMDNRMLWIHSDGAVYRVITTAYANTITDNVYRYASSGDYGDCAMEAFVQIHTLLRGQKIAQPMKYISNGLLAVIIALILNYGLVNYYARLKKPERKTLMRSVENHFNYTRPQAVFTHESKVYNPVSSGSGSSGSSRGGSGGSSGGGGGSRSGGGGGHSF
ncbi:MAG: TPM domain-containing protein [Lachnospiraceae bacterium]|nr:TPM domain-containing protein [Lachnospiraceae bacterium]